jgi:hypothetical protein
VKKIAVAALLIAFALPLRADFREAETALRAHLGAPMMIPFTGLARFVTWIIHPHGVRDFQVAIWDKKGTRQIKMEATDLDALLQRGLSRDFQQVVRRTAKHQREWTFIYARPHGDLLEVLVLNSDRGDTVLVRAEVDAEEFAETIREPRRLERIARR